MKMKKRFMLLFLFSQIVLLSAQTGNNSKIPYKMEELTSPEFVTAVAKASSVCVIPLGIIEKHGPHLPLGTDLFEAREIAFTAAKQEYAVVFPPYFCGQIFESKHQPGVIAYSTELMWKMLEETCTELSRNGLKKIILMNGHGGNNSFLEYFCQAQLMKPRDYVVVLFQPDPDQETQKEIASLKKTTVDGHAGEEETSMISYINPDLIDKDAAKNESGADQARLRIPFGYTGIWWYARFPNQYAGDGSQYSSKLGELLIKSDGSQLAELIRYLKTDNSIEKLQQEFFKRSENPLQK
jgi:creatinine amidohydrolase